MGLEQVDQTVDVVDAWILDSATREYGFEQFLDGLLGVEASTVGSITRKSRSLPTWASPRAWEPNRMT